jgi:hypothetical protein
VYIVKTLIADCSFRFFRWNVCRTHCLEIT